MNSALSMEKINNKNIPAKARPPQQKKKKLRGTNSDSALNNKLKLVQMIKCKHSQQLHQNWQKPQYTAKAQKCLLPRLLDNSWLGGRGPILM